MTASLESAVPKNKVRIRMRTRQKKVKKSQFGYRSYLVVGAQDDYGGVHTAPANQSEMVHFEAAIDGAHIEASRVYADKGSGSQCQSAVSKKAKNQERDRKSVV